MADHKVTFKIEDHIESVVVIVQAGTLVSDAARQAGVDIGQPCGGQGRCGRCAVQVSSGNVRRRSTLRLSPQAIEDGYALACQSVIEGDAAIFVPLQEKIVRNLTTDRIAAEVTVPADFNFATSQTFKRIPLTLTPPSMDDQTDDWSSPPSMDDQTDDWSRVQTALRTQANVDKVNVSLNSLRTIGKLLRDCDWKVTAILETDPAGGPARLVDLLPCHFKESDPLWGVAIDIGTTTVSLWIADLITGKVRAQVAEYNDQIARGEDVISRIIYASKNGGENEMRELVLDTIDRLLVTACKRVNARPAEILKATIAGNSTMLHLLLGIPAASIRLSPFITAVNHLPPLTAREIGLRIHPEATVDCLPGVASYVGADITAGVLACGLDQTDEMTLFIDVGTNGEIVMGNRDLQITCACSAGPAFEGAGVVNGMRATNGAIEEVWIDGETYEPSYRVIGNEKPKGICGSGLISLLSEAFLTGILDKAGNVNLTLPTPRVREGAHGAEYVVAWGTETETGEDIVLSRVDIDNLLRAKAAIYAGFTVLADQVGIPLETVAKVQVGGSFGKYINVEKAVQIGLLPDVEWNQFEFLGNTSIKGAYMALLDWKKRQQIADIASRMTYIELSADNTFYEAFTSALFLPHTDVSKFPSVLTALQKIP
jgi:uncharacterized 2Fe-2S/4Fe-4S cluster protein (DUF4445 family)